MICGTLSIGMHLQMLLWVIDMRVFQYQRYKLHYSKAFIFIDN